MVLIEVISLLDLVFFLGVTSSFYSTVSWLVIKVVLICGTGVLLRFLQELPIRFAET